MVSPLGLGTVKLGRTAGLKYPGRFELPDDGAVLKLLGQAAELGINLLDTAPAYGTSEDRLGTLLPQIGGRDRWVICTKAGEEFDGTSPVASSSFDFSPDAIRASVERSLRRLQTDRLEIVLLHSDGRDEEVIERSGAVEALQKLKAAGKVRAIGVSTKTLAGALLAVERTDVVMLTLSPGSTADLPAVQEAHKRGVGVLVKKALSSGHAANVRAALAFCLGTPGVSSVVVGTINAEHLEANVRAAATAIQPV